MKQLLTCMCIALYVFYPAFLLSVSGHRSSGHSDGLLAGYTRLSARPLLSTWNSGVPTRRSNCSPCACGPSRDCWSRTLRKWCSWQGWVTLLTVTSHVTDSDGSRYWQCWVTLLTVLNHLTNSDESPYWQWWVTLLTVLQLLLSYVKVMFRQHNTPETVRKVFALLGFWMK